MSTPTITITPDPVTGAMVASPSSLSSSGAVDIVNSFGATIYYTFATSTTWPSNTPGTSLANSNTANETITISGYFLFAANSGGPTVTSTSTTKTGPGGLAPPKGPPPSE